MALPARKNDRFNLRASGYQRRLIERAAEQKGLSYTDFILESATARATEVLADRRLFIVDNDQWERFEAALRAPAEPVQALTKLFKDQNL